MDFISLPHYLDQRGNAKYWLHAWQKDAESAPQTALPETKHGKVAPEARLQSQKSGEKTKPMILKQREKVQVPGDL